VSINKFQPWAARDVYGFEVFADSVGS